MQKKIENKKMKSKDVENRKIKKPVKRAKKNAIAKRKNNIQVVTKKTIEDYLFGHELNEKMTEAQKKLFYRAAITNQLDPFKREIHPVLYEVKKWNETTRRREGTGKYDLSIVTGYEVYIERAEASGLLRSWDSWVEGSIANENTFYGVVKIWRKDMDRPFTKRVKFVEFAYNIDSKGTRYIKSSFWKKSPSFMIEKTAIGIGFRQYFKVLKGLPLTREELIIDEKNITPQAQRIENENSKQITNGKDEKKPSPNKTEPKKQDENQQVRKAQIARIKILENKLIKEYPKNYSDEKFKNIKSDGTKGRTDSCTEMNFAERADYIKFLEKTEKEEIEIHKVPTE